MAVQVPRGLEPLEHGVQGVDALVRLVVAVAEAEGWRVGEQYVDRPTPPRPAEESSRPAVVLALGVLVGARLVAHAAAEPGDAQARRLDDVLVGIGRAVGARTVVGMVVEEVQAERFLRECSIAGSWLPGTNTTGTSTQEATYST